MGGVHLVTGTDGVLVDRLAFDVVHALLGDDDRALAVDELDGDDYTATDVVTAAQTPPFLTSRRVVVARGIERFDGRELDPLVGYLASPLDTTELVLVSRKAPPKRLADALRVAGATLHGADVDRRGRDAWVDDHVRAAGLHLDRDAKAELARHLGEDLGRVDGILETLTAAFGPGARLSLDEVAPFLGEEGTVPTWDLTDAIDRGATARALDVLHRLLDAGERHPLQIMAVLHGHVERMLALDGVGARNVDEAAAALGVKASFPLRKAMEQAGRLGPNAIRRAVQLLAQADLDLRGRRDLPEQLVVEILVARLSKLGPPPRRPRR